MHWKRSSLAILAAALATLACNLIQITPTTNPTRALATDAPSEVRPTRTSQADNPTATSAPTAAATSSVLPCPVVTENVDAIMTSCPTQCELARFNSDFDIVFEEAAGLPPYACQDGLDPSGGVNPRLAVYQALRVIAALSFDQPLPWTALDLYSWLDGTIDGIVIADTDVSYCCDSQNRIMLKADLLSQPAYASWNDPQIGIGLDVFVGLIVHEARHANIGGHTCGFDDQTLQELGAWGVQYYLFTWLAEQTSGWLTPAQIQASLGNAQTALGRICNP